MANKADMADTAPTASIAPRDQRKCSSAAQPKTQGLADADFFLTGASTALRGSWWWWTESICDPSLARFETCRPCPLFTIFDIRQVHSFLHALTARDL
ncbi:hypothetical protein HBI81_109200 [Parastagonospora nodorum]|nr:hypothetical protein HBH43_080640 [Parastagonospora nodorum]KAH4707800.1 hypothetical protein HBH67_069390 [Parastagonospora nodorum]KAH5095996.1 hypothetical protein HBH72_144710 [Parastagonospora nodorum]KAH5471079.1 hypothetical protein HBI31_194880 [Parastagonospora nodorum]KAH5518907.1 hypothetical protein HBI52_086490 [Parastagonospora nodorum]